MEDIILEGIIYDHFPTDDDDFKNGVKSDYSMDQLRESCVNEINKLINKRVKEARITECQDWLDYFKAQDDDQRIYLLENHFEKHIAVLKKVR